MGKIDGEIQPNNIPSDSSTIDPDIGSGDAFIGILIFLVLMFAGGIAWFIYEYTLFDSCKKTESVSCASFYCPLQDDGSSGTKCYDAETKTGKMTAWRDTGDGKYMCQFPTYENYVEKK